MEIAKKAAPPGRRTSSKKTTFQGSSLVDGIEYDVNGKRIQKPGETVDEEDDYAEEQRQQQAEQAAEDERTRQSEAVAVQAAKEEEEVRAEADRQEQRRAARAERERLQLLQEQQAHEQQVQEKADAEQLRASEEENRLARRKAALLARAEEEERLRQEEEAELEQQRAAYEEKMARKRAKEEQDRLAREAAEAEERQRIEEEEAELERAIVAERNKRAVQRAEQERLEREAAEAEVAEEMRRREQRVAEANAAAAAALADEDAALVEKRRRAEEQRKKRAMFLSDMDTFSDTFEAKTAVQQRERDEAAVREQEIIKANLAAQSIAYTAPARQTIDVPEYVPAAKAAEPVVERKSVPPPAPAAADEDEAVIRFSSAYPKRDSEFGNLSSSLFATGSSVALGAPMSTVQRQEEELRSATRIGSGAKKTSVVAPAAVTAVVSSPTASSPKPIVVSNPTWNPSNLPTGKVILFCGHYCLCDVLFRRGRRRRQWPQRFLDQRGEDDDECHREGELEGKTWRSE
jgi:hypothetical protein